MGAWGIGAFENDDALDWVGDLAADEGWASVEDVLEHVEPGEPPASCTHALAAAELVAAGRGHPLADLPDSAEQWLGTVGAPPPEQLVTRFIAAVETIRTASDLRASFKEAGDLRSWSAELRRLATRLTKEPRPVKKDRPPPSPENLFKRVDREIKAKRWDDAIATLTRILESEPTRVPSLNNRAWCLAQLDRFDEAAVDVERAIELLRGTAWPDRIKAACHGTRGFIRLRNRRYQEAVDDLSVSLDIDPLRHINFEHRAQAQDALGRPDLASADRRSAEKLVITEALKRANQAWENDRHRVAIAELSRVLAIEPRHTRALFRRAINFWSLKLMTEAERDLSAVIAIEPRDRYLYFRRAEVRAILGDKEGARHDRVRCHELGLDLIGFYDELIARHALSMSGRSALLGGRDHGDSGALVRITKSAMPELNFLLKLVPEHGPARKVRAQAFELVGNLHRAERERKTLDTVKPLPPPAPPLDDTTYSKWFWGMMKDDA